uniref:Uncharacterized protein n=1 Tax=Arundo donax TaxID=35708 RepID=A0A0A9EC83_ARUDO
MFRSNPTPTAGEVSTTDDDDPASLCSSSWHVTLLPATTAGWRGTGAGTATVTASLGSRNRNGWAATMAGMPRLKSSDGAGAAAAAGVSRDDDSTVLLLGLTDSALGGRASGCGCAPAKATGKLVLALGPRKWSAAAS